MIPHKCAWTGTTSDRVKEVTVTAPTRFGSPRQVTMWVLPECEEKLRRHLDYASRFGKPFIFLVFTFAGIALIASATRQLIVVAFCMLLIGVTAIVFPFATPETNSLLGIRNGRRLARAGGVVVAVLGAIVAFIAARSPRVNAGLTGQDAVNAALASYLKPEHLDEYGTREAWEALQACVVEALEKASP
jgi:hypothetical protein